MRLRFCFYILLLVATITGLAARPSLAHGTPEKTAYYKILPAFSALQQSDGISQVEYQVFGAAIVRYGGIWSTNATVDVADIWGSLPSNSSAPERDIDITETLSLEALTGAVLPTAGPTEVYKFRGHTSDGSSVNLFAAMAGSWLYLRGGSEPLSGSTNYMTY